MPRHPAQHALEPMGWSAVGVQELGDPEKEGFFGRGRGFGG
jgi:hypothetical protein